MATQEESTNAHKCGEAEGPCKKRKVEDGNGASEIPPEFSIMAMQDDLFPLTDFQFPDHYHKILEDNPQTDAKYMPSNVLLCWLVFDAPSFSCQMHKLGHDELVSRLNTVLKAKQDAHNEDLNHHEVPQELPIYMPQNEEVDIDREFVRALAMKHRLDRIDLVMAASVCEVVHMGSNRTENAAAVENLPHFFEDPDDLTVVSTGLDVIASLQNFDVPGPDAVETLDLSEEEKDKYLAALDGDDNDGPSRLLRTLAVRTRERWVRRGLGLLVFIPGLLRWLKRAKFALVKGSEGE